MKKQLLSVSDKFASFTSACSSTDTTGPMLIPAAKKIKTEVFESTEDVNWMYSRRGRGRGSFNVRGRGRGHGGKSLVRRGNRQNPVDPATGNPHKCFKCESTRHFARDCFESESDKNEEGLMVITLYGEVDEDSDG